MHKLVFMGSKQAGLEVCKCITSQASSEILLAIVCPNDFGDIRTEINSFQMLADENNIPLHIVNNTSETIEVLNSFNPSIVLVHGWYQIIPVDKLPDTLFLGFHYSPLPKYRGNAPLVWQILNGEEQLGVSFFQLTAGMDEGDLVDQQLFHLDRNENVSHALAKANALAQTMITKFLDELSVENIKLRKQPSVPASYCGLRIPADGLIDWGKTAESIYDHIRAQSRPYPGAFTYLPDGRKLTVWSSTEEKTEFYGIPGSVVAINSESVVVACGKGSIRLVDIEVEGMEACLPNQVIKSIKTRLS
jgi:methionyl-tRNA formyltransferase